MAATNEWTQLLADLTELRVAQQQRDAVMAALAEARRAFNEQKHACEQKYRKIHLRIHAKSGTLRVLGRDFDRAHWGWWTADVDEWRQGVPVDFSGPTLKPTADEPAESLESWERRVDAMLGVENHSCKISDRR
jgi:hypothetical protein